MKKIKKILYISQEIYPYLPESEIALIGRNLPQALQERGRETRIFMPRFGNINERRNQLHEVIRLSGMNLIIDDTDHPLIIKVASIQPARLQVYFIDNEDFFSRRFDVVNEDGSEFVDNDERAVFFARGVMETVKKLRWTPDLIHCQGWITALIPLYIKKAYKESPFFRTAKVVFSLHNDEFKRPFRSTFRKMLRIDGVEDEDLKVLSKKIDYFALMKLAINNSDGIIQSSKNVHSKLLKYVETANKAFLPFKSDTDYIDDYVNFYDRLL
ncbi:MAG: glycogen/starch synthase [Prevotellaceae bacterium]|jgi:starch synthase|nr:glycogen/starch synthase [Prevotellaceae bacterium]